MASEDTLEQIARCGVIPVADVRSAADAQSLVEALSAGGLPIVEIVLRTAAGVEAITALRQSHPEALVGAGTVRTAVDARRVIDAGAQFVVSPGTDVAVLETCRAGDVTAVPGVCTPTEIQSALNAGARTVKFFPAEAMGGVPFLKAIAAPFGDVRFVPTGGVDAGNLADYLCVPNVLACGGSWLVAPLAERRFDRIEALAREAVTIHGDERPL